MKVKITDIKPNPNNPRYITDEKFETLKKSIKDFPEMLKLRPIVVDDDMVVLGGNMRLKAVTDLGIEEVEIIKASELTEEQKAEFIIKDNVGFGQWDWDMLANEWDNTQLAEWGMDIWNSEENSLDDFFDEGVEQEEENEGVTIVLNYTEEDGEKVKEGLLKVGSNYEDAIFKLLSL
jgi:hypothetical protein